MQRQQESIQGADLSQPQKLEKKDCIVEVQKQKQVPFSSTPLPVDDVSSNKVLEDAKSSRKESVMKCEEKAGTFRSNEQKLIILLKQVGVEDKEIITVCLELFSQKRYSELKQYPFRRIRQRFEAMLNQLLEEEIKFQRMEKEEAKIPKKVMGEINLIEKLKQMLAYAEFKDEDIDQGVILFEEENMEDLISMIPKKHREKIAKLLGQLLENFKEFKKKRAEAKRQQNQFKEFARSRQHIQDDLIKLLESVGIADEDIARCLGLYQENNIQELKQYPSLKYRQKFGVQLDRLLEKEEETPDIDVYECLTSILKEADITDKKLIQQCHRLFEEDNIYELQVIPARQYRQQFCQSLNQLLTKISRKKVDVRKEMKLILQKVQINTEEQIDQGVELFEKGDIETILSFTGRSRNNRDLLKDLLKKLTAKTLKTSVKKKTINEILDECKIPSCQHEHYIALFQEGAFDCLLEINQSDSRKLLRYIESKYKMGKCSMETNLRITLSRYMTLEQIAQVLILMRERKSIRNYVGEKIFQIIKAIEKQYEILIHLKFMGNKRKDLIVNEIILSSQKFSLQQKIESLTQLDLSQVAVFVGEQRVDLRELDLVSKHLSTIQLRMMKTYTCRYNGKKRRISLIPQKSLYSNKLIILKQLQKQDIEFNQDFDLDKMSLTLETKYKEHYECNEQTNIFQFQEENGAILFINVSIRLKVIVLFEDIQEQFIFQSSSHLKDLRNILNEKYVPFNSQILRFVGAEQSQKTRTFADTQKLWEISLKQIIVFELIDKRSLEYYGFRKSVPLSFEEYSELFFEDKEATDKVIKNFSFAGRSKEEQFEFIRYFFSHLFFSIKRGFSIKVTIDKFKLLVSRIKNLLIWNQNSQDEALKVNGSYVVCYMLRNANLRLRVELMRVLRNSTALPLIIRQSKNIMLPQKQYQSRINQELIWVLQEGFTIASIGLHTKTFKHQKGKSNLLNEIFLTNFQNTQNSHFMAQVPFIALNVFQNLYPLHIIDIPRVSSQSVHKQILENVDMILLHSWASENQTEKYLQQLKGCYQIPVISLMRDDKDKDNSLHNLKQNYIAKGTSQNIINLSNKLSSNCQLTLLKEQIFKFIKTKLKRNQNFTKIFGLFEKNVKLNSLLIEMKQRMFNLYPISRQLQKMKEIKKIIFDDQKLDSIKQEIGQVLRPQITKILQILTTVEKPSQILYLHLLRDRLNAYQKELNCKIMKAYELMKEYLKIQEKDVKRKNATLLHLNQNIKTLIKSNFEGLVGKSDEQISVIMENILTAYKKIVKANMFSIELFWRELNYLLTIDEQFAIGDHCLFSILQEIKEIEISSSLPFQIIDGDLIEIPKKLITKFFENKEERAAVVTILGSHRSDKSTLLNFLFGCNVVASEERWTRGVYGTYFRFSKHQNHFLSMKHCEGIFVIDTEGFFETDNEKDNKQDEGQNLNTMIALFCQAVSDYVVVNVRNSADQNILKIIKLLKHVDTFNIKNKKIPQIIVVLNQNDSDNTQQSWNQFIEIKKTIDFDLSKSLTDAYQIKLFGQSEISLFDSNQKLTKKCPLNFFLEQTTDLMNQFFKQMAKKQQFSRLSEILIHFQYIWTAVQSFPDFQNLIKHRIQPSKDEDDQVQGEVNEFLKELSNSLEKAVATKKDEIKYFAQNQFRRQWSREKIQALVDGDIFTKEADPEQVLQYLQVPYKFIQKKYENFYELSWEDVYVKFGMERTAEDLMKEFFQILQVLVQLIEYSGIDESKTFRDIFELTGCKVQTFKKRCPQDKKRILYKYFIDTFLNQDSKTIRKWGQIEMKPRIPLDLPTKTSMDLRGILLEVKNSEKLFITNIAKFVKRLSSPEAKKQIMTKSQQLNKLNEKDKVNYIKKIKVLVCRENCPCCGRICGMEYDHQYHKCLYGHQMRGLNGAFIQRSNEEREASVIRCEQLEATDIIMFNGQKFTWVQFKNYFQAKKKDGWLFDDATLINNINKQRFEQAWTIAGPIYCKKMGLTYVPFNRANDQKKQIAMRQVHYIFALDQSGSVSGVRWTDLLKSFRLAIEKIKQMDGGTNKLKVSVIKYASSATLVYQNFSPSQINTNFSLNCGGTNFHAPFNMAFTLASKYISQATVIFIFMTDGKAEYPIKEIHNFKELQANYSNRLKYVGIQFDSETPVMKTICSELKGVNGVAFSSEQLTALFMRSIEINDKC